MNDRNQNDLNKADNGKDNSVHMSELSEKLNDIALSNADGIDVSPKGQLAVAATSNISLGGIAYFLGTESVVFQTGLLSSEGPLYITFAAISYLSISQLTSICGRKDGKALLASTLSGSATGTTIGLGISATAFTAIVDLCVTGGLFIIGSVAGYFIARKGRKIHRQCQSKMSCETWICTKCRHIIIPSKEWQNKTQWNILDVCDFLDTGGLNMNTIKAIAFIDYTSLLYKGREIKGFPTTWDPEKIKQMTDNQNKLETFSELWSQFPEKEEIYDPSNNAGTILKKWEEHRIASMEKAAKDV